jgi:hypothetical protein
MFETFQTWRMRQSTLCHSAGSEEARATSLQ